MKLYIIFMSIFCINFFSYAENDVKHVIAVGEATIKQDSILISPINLDPKFSSTQKKLVNGVRNIIISDLEFYKKYFKLITNKSIKKGMLGRENSALLKKNNINYTIRITPTCPSKKNSCKLKMDLYSTITNQEVYSKEINIKGKIIRRDIHKVSDSIYKKITGKTKSIFLSKVVFVSDRGTTPTKHIKELYIMDFDGKNIKQLTFHRGTVIGPAISNDQKTILYSLIKEDNTKKSRNINLYVYDVKTKRSRLLSNRKGMNSGAVFLPDGKNIALTISQSGNAEIYIMNLKTKKLKRLTRHYMPDVDPSISVDGKMMAFLSGRAGKAEVYTMSTAGMEKNVNRISYVGKFNASPRFSPDGKEIAFSSWLDNRFDIFRIDKSGVQLVRLTKNFGSNEDPSFSPDSEFILFTSLRVFKNKRLSQDIYVMTRDGDIIKAITSKFGHCLTPRWSH